MGAFIETLVPFEVTSSGCNVLGVPFQQLMEGSMEVLLCERVNDLRHSHSHLLSCLITTASELRNCLDAHLGQVVCDKDGVVDRCIVQVEMPPTRFEVCWPLPTESLSELSKKLNIVTLTLTLWPINSGLLTSLLLPHLSSSLTDSLPLLNLLCHSKTDALFMQDGPKAVWSIPYVSVAFFPSLKHNFIAHHSSKVSSHPDCIFEIHQLWQSDFSRVYSNCCCSCSFEPKIIKYVSHLIRCIAIIIIIISRW